MKITIAKDAGYCFGVRDAVNMAYDASEKFGEVYMLGDIVHNENVINDLSKTGATIANKIDDIPKDKPILFRAHGTAKDVWEEAKSKDMHIIDATCPLVHEIHNEVKKLHKENRQIIVIGDHGHDEVVAIANQVPKTIVIANPEEAKKIKKFKKAGVVSQSTQMIENVQEIISILMTKVFDLNFVNTICYPTKRNHEQIKDLSSKSDLMIIIGSFTSANSMRLTELSKQRNKNTHQVICADDLKTQWFDKVKSVGISAGASTPDYLIEGVANKIRIIAKERTEMKKNNFEVKVGLAEMLKGGVIMDVTTADQAKIAENSGAVAVMALERIPADIREDGGVARMSSPRMIKEIQDTVSIPVMAKCRIGHILEAKILEALEVDFIDESEVLTPADNENHIYKKDFTIPFVCGARDLGEALRRINEGAAMMRTKGEAGSGNIVEAVKHMRKITETIEELSKFNEDQLKEYSEQVHVPFLLVSEVAETKKIPVPNFSAGGIATPADAALMMHLGAQSVFVGSGIFKSTDPKNRAKAIVEATTYYDNPKKLSEISMDLKEAMPGIEISEIPKEKMLQNRGC